MATYKDHLSQAKHNECLCKYLAEDPSLDYKDWLITAAFYSALHYIEANLYADPSTPRHVDTSCPPGYSKHDWRLRLVAENYSLECYKSYKKLFDASMAVRYLENWRRQPGAAMNYYLDATAKLFYTRDLQQVKSDLHHISG